jgi:hypothetical protein
VVSAFTVIFVSLGPWNQRKNSRRNTIVVQMEVFAQPYVSWFDFISENWLKCTCIFFLLFFFLSFPVFICCVKRKKRNKQRRKGSKNFSKIHLNFPYSRRNIPRTPTSRQAVQSAVNMKAKWKIFVVLSLLHSIFKQRSKKSLETSIIDTWTFQVN